VKKLLKLVHICDNYKAHAPNFLRHSSFKDTSFMYAFVIVGGANKIY